MNLNAIANLAAKVVNPNKSITLLRSTGYTTSSTGHKQVPAYATAVTGYGNIQALDALDLRQMEGLNVQGTIKAVFFNGVLKGVDRPDGTGGDIVQVDGQSWLVVKVLESWSGWEKAAIVLQG